MSSARRTGPKRGTAALAAFCLIIPLVAALSVSNVSAAGALTNPTWYLSATTAGTTGVSYTFGFTIATTSSLNSVKMTVPTGTSGATLTVGTVMPTALATGGGVSLSGTTLTYTFTATSLSSGIRASIQVNGLKNTATTGSDTATITTANAATTVDTGTTPALTITTKGLTSPSWSPSTTSAAATGVTYSFGFTTATTATLASVTVTVPLGTAGTPAVGTVSGVPTGGTASLSGTSLKYSFTAKSVASGTAASVQFTGLTNTTVAGIYAPEIVTSTTSAAVDSGTSTALAITGVLTLTSPASFTWAAKLTGINQSVVDTTAADEQLTVADSTASGAGWHVTVSATTPTAGAHALPTAGSLVYTGSISSVSATTAPTATCSGTCTLPTNTTTYPVAITTAATSPPTFTIYDTQAGTGIGTVVLGGNTAANPGGWWLNVPANAFAGTYTSTITLAIVSGP